MVPPRCAFVLGDILGVPNSSASTKKKRGRKRSKGMEGAAGLLNERMGCDGRFVGKGSPPLGSAVAALVSAAAETKGREGGTSPGATRPEAEGPGDSPGGAIRTGVAPRPTTASKLTTSGPRLSTKPSKRRFTVIVLDPPWPSRSVARAGAYETMRTAKTGGHGGGLGDKSRNAPSACGEHSSGSCCAAGGCGCGGGEAATIGQQPRPSKRAGHHRSFSPGPELAALCAIPFASALADADRGCLVGVWVTNQAALVEWAAQVLLPSLGATGLRDAPPGPGEAMDEARDASDGASFEQHCREPDPGPGSASSADNGAAGPAQEPGPASVYWLKVRVSREML